MEAKKNMKMWILLQQMEKTQMKAKEKKTLKVQWCKLYDNKYMIASTQIANTEIFAYIAVLVFKLLSRKVLFINRKDNKK